MATPTGSRLLVGNLLYRVQPEEVLDVFKEEETAM